MVCGDCARLAAVTELFTRLWRRALRFVGRKNSMGLLTTLFLVRAAQLGQLQRWAVLVSKLSDDPFWPSATSLLVATLILPVPRVVVVGPAVIMMIICDVEFTPGLLFGALAWLMQSAQLLSELLCSFKEFLLCSLKEWSFPRPWRRPDQHLAEWFAAVVFGLWVASVLYQFVGMRLERFVAKQRLRSRLQGALKNPFRATFKENFSRTAERGMRRSFSSQFLSEFSAEQLERFRQKHLALLVARRELLEEESAYTEDMVPNCFSILLDRCHVLEESYQALQEAPAFEFLAPTLMVQYRGEEGEDHGGVTQDWFASVGAQLTRDAGSDDSTSVFAMGKSSRMLIPRPGQDADAGRFRDLFLAGRFLALAVLHGGRPLPLPLSPLVCKYMVGKPVDLDDVKSLDPDFYHQRVAPLLQPGGLDAVEKALGEPLTFMSAPTELRCAEELDLGGALRVVTEENKERYLMLLCEAFLCSELREELQCLLKGFWDVLPLVALQKAGLEASDLSMFLMGSHSLDLAEWREFTVEHGEGRVLEWFWQTLQESDEQTRRQLLRFCTGSSRLPPGGFAELSPRFTVEVSGAGSPEHLPHAHTCINKLVLHQYSSPCQLRGKLLQALPTESFGFA